MSFHRHSTPACLKLTFNKPAHQTFFEGMVARGIAITIQDGAATFKPVDQEAGSNVVCITQNERGGIEAVVEGDLADEPLAVLNKPHADPYVMLSRSKGWIVTSPYTGAQQVPPCTKPQLGVWIKAGSEPFSAMGVETVQQMSPEQLHVAIHKAKAVTARHGARIKPGRLPRELSQARELLQAMSSVHAPARFRARARLGGNSQQ
jgi:hypothetical protein